MQAPKRPGVPQCKVRECFSSGCVPVGLLVSLFVCSFVCLLVLRFDFEGFESERSELEGNLQRVNTHISSILIIRSLPSRRCAAVFRREAATGQQQ